MTTGFPDLSALLPDDRDVWLCVIYGSASFGALGPQSDIDVLAEGHQEAIDGWVKKAERVTGREVNPAGVDYMLKQPMMVQQILDTPIVLRDSRDRLGDMQRAVDKDDRLRTFQMRILGEALDEYPQKGPPRPITGAEQRFMEALAGVRNEYKKVANGRTALERQWAVERLTRALRNLLRNWPERGDYAQPRQTIENLSGVLADNTLAVLRELPYEYARSDPVDLAIEIVWTQAQTMLADIIQDVTAAAELALRGCLDTSDHC